MRRGEATLYAFDASGTRIAAFQVTCFILVLDRIMTRLITAVLASALLFPAAQAATITYDGTGVNGYYQSKTEVSGDVSVTTSVGTWSKTGQGQGSVTEADTNTSAWINEGSWGLAVQNYEEVSTYCWWWCRNYYSDTHQIDGHGLKEAVIFSFDHDVTLDSVMFNTHYLHDHDDFVLFAGDSLDDLTTFTLFKDIGETASLAGEFTLDIVGKVFAIGAKGKHSAFKITALDYTKWVPENPPTPTPVPGDLPLMLTALGGFGFMRSRRKAA